MNSQPVIPPHETRRFLLCAGDGTIDLGRIIADVVEVIRYHPARIKQFGNMGFRNNRPR